MQDAEEKVSPEVWKRVSASLGGAAAPKRVLLPAWMWKTAIAVAAAAAVAAGVFFLRPGDTNSNYYINNLSETVAAAETPVVTAPAEETAPAAIPPIAEQISSSRTKLLADIPAKTPETAVAAAEAAPAGQQEEEEAPTPASDRQEEHQAGRIDTAPLLIHDPFADLEKKSAPAPAGKGFAITAGGSVFGSHSSSDAPVNVIKRAPGAGALQEGVTEISQEKTFYIPVSAAVEIRYNFTPKLGVGTGLAYTSLRRTFTGSFKDAERLSMNVDIDNVQHYLGVPVNFYYNFVNTKAVNVYGMAGATFEKLLANKYVIHDPAGTFSYSPSSASGYQISAGIGVGVQWNITPTFGLYVDPSLKYYFPNSTQPRSFRTIQPLMMSLEAGVRFNLGK